MLIERVGEMRHAAHVDEVLFEGALRIVQWFAPTQIEESNLFSMFYQNVAWQHADGSEIRAPNKRMCIKGNISVWSSRSLSASVLSSCGSILYRLSRTSRPSMLEKNAFVRHPASREPTLADIAIVFVDF